MRQLGHKKRKIARLTLNDFVNNSIGALLANIVDNNVSTEFPVHVSVGAAEACTSTGDDDGFAVEADFRG